jgi:uncharacterized protein (TIGR04222 family)
MGLGPFDLTGGPFLWLYAIVIVLACVASWRLSEARRPEGRPGKVRGEDELALLAGGEARLAEAAATRLLVRGDLVQRRDDALFAVGRDKGSTAAEQAILRLTGSNKWKDILVAVGAAGDRIRMNLVSSGLMLDPDEHRRLKRTAIIPLLLAAAFGAIKLVIGVERHRPVLLLVIFLVVTALLVLARFWSVSGETKAGKALVETERKRHERLRRAPLKAEMGMSVALFGTVVLVGSEFAGFHALRHKQGDSGGDGSSSGGCGGDGGCGGCGGCGG